MATDVTTTQPTVTLLIEGSAIAFDASGEIIESVERHADGSVDWRSASICDHRGMGGANGYAELATALNAAEGNAALCGIEIIRVSVEDYR